MELLILGLSGKFVKVVKYDIVKTDLGLWDAYLYYTRRTTFSWYILFYTRYISRIKIILARKVSSMILLARPTVAPILFSLEICCVLLDCEEWRRTYRQHVWKQNYYQLWPWVGLVDKFYASRPVKNLPAFRWCIFHFDDRFRNRRLPHAMEKQPYIRFWLSTGQCQPKRNHQHMSFNF